MQRVVLLTSIAGAIAIFLSLGSLPMMSADALSAVTVTDKTTLTSLTSGRWERVWLNDAGTIVYFLDVSTDSVKIVKVNATDGTTISTNTVTAGSGSNPAMISDVFTVSSTNYVAYAQQNTGTPTTINTARVNIDAATASTSTGATSCTTAATPIAIAVTKNKIYYIDKNNSSNSLCWSSSALDLTGFANIGNGLQTNMATGGRCEVTTDGATSASDVFYCGLPHNAGSIVAEFAGTSYTNMGSLGSGSAGVIETFKAGDFVVVRTETSGTEVTGTVTPSTATYNGQTDTTDWVNWNLQSTHLVDSSRSYSPVSQFLATSSTVTAYDTSGNVDKITMPAVTVNSATASISWFTDAFYRVNEGLYATSVTTTTTPKTVSTTTEIDPTAYSENIGVPIVQNDTLFSQNVFKVVCDAAYVVRAGLLVGSDSDCDTWRVLATSSATVGREIDYSRTALLVHNPVFTAYTMQIGLSNPSLYRLLSYYNGTVVDSIVFDSSATGQQRYVYGNCYHVRIYKTETGEIMLDEDEGFVCANDVITKPAFLSTSSTVSVAVYVPNHFTGTTWDHAIVQRNMTDPLNNTIYYRIGKTVTPFNVTIHVFEESGAVNTWYNYTNQNSTIYQTIEDLSIFNNYTIWIQSFENDVAVVTDVSGPEFPSLNTGFGFIGQWVGLGFGYAAVLFIAVKFDRDTRDVGLIVISAVIALFAAFGLLEGMDLSVVGLMLPIVAIGVVSGARRLF